MIEVRLSWAELTIAGQIGAMRHVSALKEARPSAYGYSEDDSWTTHIEGAAAEMAVAKALDRYWPPLINGSLSASPGDIGNGIQVRSTGRKDGCLIVHPKDNNAHVFYLVISHTPPVYRIVGSMIALAAKHDDFWRTNGVRHPAFFVPQDELIDVSP